MAYRPTLGGGGDASFPLQFPTARVDQISLAVTPIELLSNDGADSTVSHGTGFFWRAGERTYLVTARHVLSGRDPFTDEGMSKKGYFPERIRIYPTLVVDEAGTQGRSEGNVVPLTIDGVPLWLEDPQFAQLRTDIAALRIGEPPGQRLVCLNDSPDHFASLFTHIGFECSIIGYPTTHLAGLRTPVWRRGTIASEPSLPVDGKPMFLMDASTSPGFSGSPVFRRHIGPAPVEQPNGSLVVLAGNVLTTSFVGVYAGRLEHAFYGGEVPFVFYGNRIEQVIGRDPL